MPSSSRSSSVPWSESSSAFIPPARRPGSIRSKRCVTNELSRQPNGRDADIRLFLATTVIAPGVHARCRFGKDLPFLNLGDGLWYHVHDEESELCSDMANEGIGRATLLDRSRRREPTAARALHKQADGIVREHRWQRRAKEDLFQHRHEWTGSRSGSHRSKTFSGMSGQSSNPSPWCFAVRRLARHKGPFGLALFWSVIFIVVPMQVPLITGALIDSLKGKHVRLYGLELDPAKRQRSVKIAALALMGVALTRG